jgi:hypothetical protein
MNNNNERTRKDVDANIKPNDQHDDGQTENVGSPNRSSDAGGGEDASSTEIEGDDSHLHEDQKSRKLGEG